jgi:hypothetical protein
MEDRTIKMNIRKWDHVMGFCEHDNELLVLCK